MDGNDSRTDEVDDNKHIEVDTHRPKWNMVDLPTLKKKLWTLPSSLSSDLTELSQSKREQIFNNNQYKFMQFVIWERKLELLEQKSTIKMENLRAEAAREHLNVEKERLQFKVYLLWQRAQMLKEGVLQDDIDSALPSVND